MSHHIRTLDTAHISALRLALKQQQLSIVHALLHVQESSSSSSSGAGLDPSHTNPTVFRCCLLLSRVHQESGLPEGEQWLFSKFLLDNLLLLREVVKMTCKAAEPLAPPSRLWRSRSHSAEHLHFGTSSRKSDTRGLPYL